PAPAVVHAGALARPAAGPAQRLRTRPRAARTSPRRSAGRHPGAVARRCPAGVRRRNLPPGRRPHRGGVHRRRPARPAAAGRIARVRRRARPDPAFDAARPGRPARRGRHHDRCAGPLPSALAGAHDRRRVRAGPGQRGLPADARRHGTRPAGPPPALRSRFHLGRSVCHISVIERKYPARTSPCKKFFMKLKSNPDRLALALLLTGLAPLAHAGVPLGSIGGSDVSFEGLVQTDGYWYDNDLANLDADDGDGDSTDFGLRRAELVLKGKGPGNTEWVLGYDASGDGKFLDANVKYKLGG